MTETNNDEPYITITLNELIAIVFLTMYIVQVVKFISHNCSNERVK